jgi:adenosine deaminase
MTNDVTQWLAEIKALKQKLVEAEQACEQAYASAANWQRLYETEAQQRRTETQLSRQTIADLKRVVQQLQERSLLVGNPAAELTAIRAEVEQLQTVPELRERLIAALAERDRLLQALQTEQENHAQTRRSLTTALGDAIDLLSKEQGKAAPPDRPAAPEH